MLYRLVYHSVASFEPRSAEAGAYLSRIVERARANNARMELTGVLLHDTRGFVQVLEGQRGAISRLFGRILVDRRHMGVMLDDFRPARARLFPHAPMAYAAVSGPLRERVAAALAKEDPAAEVAELLKRAELLPAPAARSAA